MLLRYVLLLALTALAVCHNAAAQPLPVTQEPLASDARLAQKVRLRAEGLPVTELLDLLSQKTGVSLSVEKDIGEEKVAAFNAARPLRDILTDIATLFNNAWERVEDKGQAPRYHLYRGRRSRQYEDGLAYNTTRRVLAQLQVQVQALNETPEQLAQRLENDPIRVRLSNPKTRLGTLLYGALSPSQQEILLSQHSFFVRFSDLTPPQQTAVRDMFAGFVAENHAELQRMQEQNPGAVIHNRRLEIEDMDADSVCFFVDGGWSALMIAFSLTGDLSTAGTIADFHKPSLPLLPLHGNPYTGSSLNKSAPMPNPHSIAAAREQKDWLDALRTLSEASGLPVMADFFRVKREKAASQNPAPISASQGMATGVDVMDALCQPQNYLWWSRGKSLLFRTRTWYDALRYEIPDRWLLDVSKRLQAQRGNPTYADVLRLLELTPDQMYGLQSMDATGRLQAFAQEKELAATHNLLELLRDNASPQGNRVPVPTWDDLVRRKMNKTLAQVIVTYDNLTPGQRSQIPAYLRT